MSLLKSFLIMNSNFLAILIQMKDILNCNGVTYKKVILSSVYIASLALTFQVDLDVEDQSNNVSRFTSFVSSSASFSSFSNYSVKGSGRGTLGVTVKGKENRGKDICRSLLKVSGLLYCPLKTTLDV